MRIEEPGQRAERSAAWLADVHNKLSSIYGLPEWRAGRDPVKTLVRGILSQNTSDTNSERAYRALRSEYPHWDAVLGAAHSDLADSIRSGGLADQKARRIKEAVAWILAENGELSLDWLLELSVSEARERLTGINGIGHKTASIVLLFALGRPAFPVDTHVGRVLRRLGLVPPKAGPEKIMTLVEAVAPPHFLYPLHLNLVRHGRQTCSARKPACGDCGLSDQCHHVGC